MTQRKEMRVALMARPQFLGVLAEAGQQPRDDQMQGTTAEQLIEYAGRSCYDSFGGKGRSSVEYHEHIQEVGHGSVTQHAWFSFDIRGISRALSLELNRHAVGTAISQRSTRYVQEDETDYVVHPAIAGYMGDPMVSDVEKAMMEAAVNHAIETARTAYRLIAARIEAQLEIKGCSKLTARKQARGAARNYLGNGLETSGLWSFNVRSLRWILSMRGDEHADAEIRLLALKLWEIVQIECPAYFDQIMMRPCEDGLVPALSKLEKL